MYYLVIKNMGVEKCIDKNKDDIYENDQSYSFLQDLTFVKNRIIRRIKIHCIETYGTILKAIVYSD